MKRRKPRGAKQLLVTDIVEDDTAARIVMSVGETTFGKDERGMDTMSIDMNLEGIALVEKPPESPDR